MCRDSCSRRNSGVICLRNLCDGVKLPAARVAGSGAEYSCTGKVSVLVEYFHFLFCVVWYENGRVFSLRHSLPVRVCPFFTGRKGVHVFAARFDTRSFIRGVRIYGFWDRAHRKNMVGDFSGRCFVSFWCSMCLEAVRYRAQTIFLRGKERYL